jgi:glyceraldehyde-3-phosphate dehydrogenase/erythrose-4-phosphate dehydrogenase
MKEHDPANLKWKNEVGTTDIVIESPTTGHQQFRLAKETCQKHLDTTTSAKKVIQGAPSKDSITPMFI